MTATAEATIAKLREGLDFAKRVLDTYRGQLNQFGKESASDALTTIKSLEEK